MTERNFDRVEKLEAWASKRGRTLLELAFGWLLGQPGVSSVIPGATSPSEVSANAPTADWRLEPAAVAEVIAIVQ